VEYLDYYKRIEGINVRKFNEEYYIIGNGKAFKANETCIIILKYVGKKISISELTNKILLAYSGAEYEKIYKDIENFIDFLVSQNIIEEVKNE